MTTNAIMGLISSATLFLPICLILIFRLGAYKTFPALLIYYGTVFAYNICRAQLIPADNEALDIWNTCNNFLDAPLMLYFLTYFSTSTGLTKKMRQLIIGIILFELIVVSIVGFNTKAVTIFLGPSILIVFGFCLHFFVRQTKITISHHKAAGKAIITASLLFAYGCYAIIYLMYYVIKTPYVADTFLIYFLVVTISSLGMCAGIIVERKRILKLTELLQTRKELSVIYKNETQPVRSIRTVALDFDKDPWV